MSALDEETRKQETGDSDLPPSLHSGKPSLPKKDMPWAARLLWGSPLLVALAAAVGGCLLLRSHTVSWLAPAALVSSALFLMFGSAILLGVIREDGLRTEETDSCADDCGDLYWALSKVKDDTLRGLAWVNFKQLRTFTVIAQRQTRMSYYASITAAAVAFLVLTSGAAVAIGLPTTAAKITAGTLATVGTVLSGFLAKTFLKAYQMASRQMSYYYGQPLVHCYLLHAEWLALEAGERFGGEAELHLWHEVIDASIKASAHAQDHLLSMRDINAKWASRGL
ncbi:MAG: hypothetical protein WA895_09520 [Streptosporangiaceae bacterium]